jgi:hypothetical protein
MTVEDKIFVVISVALSFACGYLIRLLQDIEELIKELKKKSEG